ncbi:MAG: hypothetical protein K9J21_10510 [Bacteroidales bacterium]|nr:hypothetical protein [Bacteroidales bacterium]
MTKQEQIYADINAALQSELSAPSDSLSGLQADVDAGNQVAEHRIWSKIFAFASYVLDQLFRKHKAEVEAYVNAPKLYGMRWIQEMALKYQHGNSLNYIDGVYVYENPVDPLLRYCSISMSGKNVLVKAAKDGPTPLVQSEKDGLTSYLEKVLYPGTHFTVVSQAADMISYDITVYRDPVVMDSAGGLVAEPSVKPVEEAIRQFIENLPFDSVFNRNSFIDAIQSAEGVQDVTIERLQYKYGSLPYTDVGREVTSMAGYYQRNNCVIDYNVS